MTTMVTVRAPKVKKTISRHLEGWQVGLVAVGVAGLGVALAVPRPVSPTELPLPRWDHAAVRDEAAADARRAETMRARDAKARTERYDQRAAGDCFRRFGVVDAAQDTEGMAEVRPHCVDASRILLASPDGAEQLRELRAYQTEAFVAALGAWSRGGPLTRDLVELGGSLPRDIVESGWLPHRGALEVPRDVCALLFKVRFSEVMGVRKAVPIELDEARRVVAFFLERPPRNEDPRVVWQFLEKKVEEAGKLDPTYPTSLARGIVALGLGDARKATAVLGELQAERPDGRWALRARNALAAAARMKEQEGEAP